MGPDAGEGFYRLALIVPVEWGFTPNLQNEASTRSFRAKAKLSPACGRRGPHMAVRTQNALRRSHADVAPAAPIRCASRQLQASAELAHPCARSLRDIARCTRYAFTSPLRGSLGQTPAPRPALACDARRALRRVVALGPRIRQLLLRCSRPLFQTRLYLLHPWSRTSGIHAVAMRYLPASPFHPTASWRYSSTFPFHPTASWRTASCSCRSAQSPKGWSRHPDPDVRGAFPLRSLHPLRTQSFTLFPWSRGPVVPWSRGPVVPWSRVPSPESRVPSPESRAYASACAAGT